MKTARLARIRQMFTAGNLPEVFSSRRGRNIGQGRLGSPSSCVSGCFAQSGRRVLLGMPFMRGAQPFDGRDRSDSATSSVRLAVQPCGGTSKFEGLFEIPAIENAIGESRVKKVAGAGSVRYGNTVGRAVTEAMAIPGDG